MNNSLESIRRRVLAAGLFTAFLVAAPATAAGRATAAVDYAALVEQHGPAVVHVSVREKLAKVDDKAISGSKPEVIRANSFGSGFIVSADGYILTNAHVVSQATEIRVTLKDKRELPARIVGEDATTDVALLKVQAYGLPKVSIGKVQDVRVGEPVAAIGSPFGFEHSVTAGIVSAKSRNVDDLMVPFIQTDAAVNPGNSGGPLFNADGEVIGINSRIWTKSGGFQGLSFAIPIDLAMQIAESLKSGRKIVRGRIGIRTQQVSSELARAFGLDRPRGALVSSVDPEGPAQLSGFQTGDIVLSAAGLEIETSLDLQRVVGSQPLDTAISVEVLRQGQTLPLRVKVAAAQKPGAASEPVSVSVHEKMMPLGLELRATSAQEQQRYGLRDGLYVESVAARSPAVRAELKAGDVILQVRGRALRDVSDFRDGVESAAAAGVPVAVLTMRGDEKRFVALELDR
ncbi:MAG: trypsin-like peptidase domain-containing protein [Lautropia sp.]|nr:trypsin-like peptidase domain-containing protein [Lautropia sp.]